MAERLTRARLDEIVADIAFRDWTFRVDALGDGWFLQVEFPAEDHDPPYRRTKQRGRKWYVSPYAIEGEVVQTALKAILTALEHEAREEFKYRDRAIFGPHLSVDRLLTIAEQTEVRP